MTKQTTIPVVDAARIPLSPCHPARARELLRKGKALKRFDKTGEFYIQLRRKVNNETQN